MRFTIDRLLAAGPGWVLGLLLTTLSALGLAPRAADANPAQGPGGPILVVTSSAPEATRFGTFYAEILRTEGFNAFYVTDIAAVTPALLVSYDVVLLARMPVSAFQATTLGDWVDAGGNLIAMDPDPDLHSLLGITGTGDTLSDRYLSVDPVTVPGSGIYRGSMQFHGSASLYSLNGAARLATLYSDANTASIHPAVTLRSVGLLGGQAAAFAFDLATSIVYTRQGNPAWIGDDRDGALPPPANDGVIRANDLFFGNKTTDPQPDWIDHSKLPVPQADEQQRFLANLITHMNIDRKPLPRFWYFPNDYRAAVLLTADDHGAGGWVARFDSLAAQSPVGCSLLDWTCLRGTVYVYPDNAASNDDFARLSAQGFEISLHLNTGCANFTPAELDDYFVAQLGQFATRFGLVGIPAPESNRSHCIAWSAWATTPKVGSPYGVRLDTNYYFWPPGWVNGVPGHFTGSAMPMRFADHPDGTLIDAYQAVTQMTDESQQSYPFTIDALLDRALGPEEHYGVFTANAHSDGCCEPDIAPTIVASAIARGVPLISAKQLLDWLDARNASSFDTFSWDGTALAFDIVPGAGATGLRALLPYLSASGALTTIHRGGLDVAFEVTTVKGVDYAAFPAAAGAYVATYAPDLTTPALVVVSPQSGASNVPAGSSLFATFSESMDPASLNTSTFLLRDASNAPVSGVVSYDAGSRTATFNPAGSLADGATYTATVKGGPTPPHATDLLGTPLPADFAWSFTVADAPVVPPSSAWPDTTVPTLPSVNESDAVELGVSFRVSVDGFITGIRFYKGAANTGAHTGSLWSNAGTRLATATFTAETPSGWQTVYFESPVAITANTVYVASYYAPNGGYAFDGGYFATTGYTSGSLYLLKDGEGGEKNGRFFYGTGGGFPNDSFGSSNYWVDVIFTNVDPASDLTPPEITATSPVDGATGVATDTTVSASFSEPLDPTSVDVQTVELRDAANTLVPASVVYDAVNRRAVLSPTSALAAGTVHTATVRGGTAGPSVKDEAGNALAAGLSWSFTTIAASGGCPCSIWADTATPLTVTVDDPQSIELGVKFRSDVGGFVTGIRFYKGPQNLGTHVGNLWSSDGALLASGQFTSETASGWQQVTFAAPVSIAAGTVYIASYLAPQGQYSATGGAFAAAGVDNGVLHALRNGEAGANGVYMYGPASAFPTATFNATNYWVDVVFVTTGVDDVTPPVVVATTPLDEATAVPVASAVTATFSEALDAASVSAATVVLRDPSNNAIAASVTYGAASHTVTLTPSAPLAPSTIYTATLRGGENDPRIRDLAGNALSLDYSWSFTTAAAPGCSGNPIVVENCKPGSPPSEWDVAGAGDPGIQGFATDISVGRGGTISFKVDTDASGYRFDIYRLGFYGGLGARKVTSVNPTASLPQAQPACLSEAATGLIDCGNWAVSGQWSVPANAISGVYVAKLVRTDTGGASHVVFVVRDDASTSDLLFQTSDTTWQAYNNYGGRSLYFPSQEGRAYKVSYNRPFNTRATDNGQDWVFNAEYPMIRWLEANGYDVSYTTGLDTDRRGHLILGHRAFLSVGHDEYWSADQRTHVETARDAGVSLAFLSGNEIFWKTRWEPSIDASATANRTLVSYKETHDGARIDPTGVWTGTWRDPRFSPPADGGRPENALSGTIFMVNDGPGGTESIVVRAADGKMRFWRNTTLATLADGTSAALPFGTLGYEWDEDLDNGFRPAGLIQLSWTVVNGVAYLQDFGSTFGSGTATHTLTLYKAPSGALVFGAGTVQWSWGLDANHDRAGTIVDPRMQQATVNLFADMGVQPETLQAGLVAAIASTDGQAPSSSISNPVAGTVLDQGTPITVIGTAVEVGGGAVGGVEVSTDDGVTWHRAEGRGEWSYRWTPTMIGPTVIRSRATDDSGNTEAPSAGVAVTISSDLSCPCSIWSAAATPTVVQDVDTGAVEVGVKFRSDVAGFITGVRFYKGPANGGTHIGNLWSAAGTLLATATFTNESATGWQQVDFASPVAIDADTVYVASYYAPHGRYAGDNRYFEVAGVDRGVLHALRDGESGFNGVYSYGSASVFPSQSYLSSNYWVDVVFDTESDPVLVGVPNVVGQLQAAATAAITNAGLALGTVVVQSSPTVPVGQVISQHPAAGELVAPGSTVNLVVSSGVATGPALASLTLRSAVVSGCRSVTATVTLTEPAPAAGVVVALGDTLASVTTPATLKISAGAIKKSVSLKTSAVAAEVLGTVSAMLGGATKSQPLTVKPMGISSLTLSPTSVVGGNPVVGVVKLECAAGPGAVIVDLASNAPAAAQPVAASIAVPQGARSAPFNVTTHTVLGKTSATISGIAGGVTRSRRLTVYPAGTVSPTQLKFGDQVVNTTSGARRATLSNEGTVSFDIIGIALTGTNARYYAQMNDCPPSLEAGASCSIDVTFAPTVIGKKSARLSIATSATSVPLNLTLSGTGVTPPP